MILCHCFAVSHREVHAAVRQGATGVEDVIRLCGAGGDCGGCIVSIEDVLEDHEVPVLLRTSS